MYIHTFIHTYLSTYAHTYIHLGISLHNDLSPVALGNGKLLSLSADFVPPPFLASAKHASASGRCHLGQKA